MSSTHFWLDPDYRLRTSPKLLKFRSLSGTTSIAGTFTLLMLGIVFTLWLIPVLSWIILDPTQPLKDGISVTGAVRQCTYQPAEGRREALMSFVIEYVGEHGEQLSGYVSGIGDSVNWTGCDKFPVGTPLALVYAPERPDSPRITDGRLARPWWFGLDRGFLVVCVGGGAIIWCLVFFLDMLRAIQIRKNYHLICRIGQRLDGEIITCTGKYIYPYRSYAGPNFEITVEYKFLTPQQVELSHKVSTWRNDLTPQTLPAPGTPVIILYANDLIYCLL